MTTGRTSGNARGRRSLLALATLFVVPLAAAFWLYYGAPGLRPRGAANRGELIHPAVPLRELAFASPDGRAIDGDLLRGRWTLLYIGPQDCDPRCRDVLYLTRQTRLALNKDSDRVRRLFLATGPCCPDPALLAEHPDPSEAEVRLALSGNLCRCTGYQHIVDAVLLFARRRREAASLP